MSLTPLDLERDFEFEPPQSPLLEPAQHNADESPTTPKRKREADSDNIEDRDSPSKRSSPLQQVAIPDTLGLTAEEEPLGHGASSQTQLLTPMKRSVSSSQKSTPVTLVKGVNRFRLDSDSSPNGHGPADPFNLASSTTSHSLVKPRLINSTTSSKSEASRTAGTSAATAIDLDSDGTEDAINHSSAIDNNSTKKQAATPATPSTSKASPTTPASRRLPSDRISRPANPTPNKATTTAAPQKPLSALQKIPAIAPQYVPVYVSPDSPVKLRDSKQFCIYPPFWKRWHKDQYLALARYLEENINLVPFAEEQGLTVEEVQHVYQAVVVEPVLQETDKLAEAGQKRIETMFKTYDKTKGKTWRKWGDEDSSVDGDLAGVRPGIVQLIGKNADLIEVPLRKMTKADIHFVMGLISEEERAILMRQSDC